MRFIFKFLLGSFLIMGQASHTQAMGLNLFDTHNLDSKNPNDPMLTQFAQEIFNIVLEDYTHENQHQQTISYTPPLPKSERRDIVTHTEDSSQNTSSSWWNNIELCAFTLCEILSNL